MISARDLHPSNFTFENNLISCFYVTSKLNILSNQAKHPKGLVCLLYALPLFTSGDGWLIKGQSLENIKLF